MGSRTAVTGLSHEPQGPLRAPDGRPAQAFCARRCRIGATAPSASRREVTRKAVCADHPVLRPDREAHRVPRPQQRLPGVRLGPARPARAAPRRRWTAGSSSPRSRPAPRRAAAPRPRSAAPPTAPACRGRRGRRPPRPGARPGRRAAATSWPATSPKNAPTFAARDVGEVLAALVAGHRAAGRRPPAAASRSARRSRAGLQHPHARGRRRRSRRSARRPSGRSPARRAAWTARSRPAAAAAPGSRCWPSSDDGALRRADEVVVLDRAAVGVELLAGFGYHVTLTVSPSSTPRCSKA